MPIAAHERISKDGTSDVWLTPRWVIMALGPFDLDPCAAPSPRPWATAAEHIELPADGLAEDWRGRVWLNPPYSDAEPWLERMASHRNGIALLFARVETRAWQDFILPVAHRVFFPRGRIAFCFPDGRRKDGAGAPSAFVLLHARGHAQAQGKRHQGKICETRKRGRLMLTVTTFSQQQDAPSGTGVVLALMGAGLFWSGVFLGWLLTWAVMRGR